MRESMLLPNQDRRRRLSPLGVWVLCALPWLALVTGLSLYDHQRAVGVMVQAATADSAGEVALHWLIAAISYCGEAIAFYGLLPAGITFVLFLPWAIRFAQGGDYRD